MVGRPCKHHFPDGVDQYSDFKPLPAGDYVPVERPAYCPAWDAKPVMPTPPNFPDQDWICTKCWVNGGNCKAPFPPPPQ